MHCLAFDVGGANVKFSDGLDRTGCIPLALWKSPDQLAGLLTTVIASAAACTAVGVTMTGELADCFPSKAAGVRYILASVCKAARGVPVRVYLVDGRLVSPELAVAEPMLAAASNWHVLARLAGRYVPAGAALPAARDVVGDVGQPRGVHGGARRGGIRQRIGPVRQHLAW